MSGSGCVRLAFQLSAETALVNRRWSIKVNFKREKKNKQTNDFISGHSVRLRLSRPGSPRVRPGMADSPQIGDEFNRHFPMFYLVHFRRLRRPCALLQLRGRDRATLGKSGEEEGFKSVLSFKIFKAIWAFFSPVLYRTRQFASGGKATFAGKVTVFNYAGLFI